MEWDINALLFALGATGLFTSRALVPAFLTALMMRYGGSLPFLGDIEFLQTSGQEPSWFTHNGTIFILGALAIAEILANKSPDLEELMETFYKSAKSIMAALTTLGVLNSGDTDFVLETIGMSQAGLWETSISMLVAAAVWIMATLRNLLMEVVMFADPDGSIGLRKLISWFEDIWAAFGIIFLFLYPIGMTILIVGVMLTMALLKYIRQRQEEKSKRPCPQCNAPVYPCALVCPSCQKEQSNVQSIGFFAQSIDKPIADRQSAAIHLAEKKRCPKCASRLRKRDPLQQCTACSHTIFEDPQFNREYMAQVSSRLPKVLVISALFSLIPILGLIPGVIYYRIALVAPFMGYLPAGRSILLKILLRIILLLLIGMQLIPGLGAISVPLMALLSYGLYRSAFANRLQVTS